MATAPKPALSPASQDLGMGDQLQQQLSDEEIQRKKKLMQQANGMSPGMGMAASVLFPGTGGFGASNG